MKIKRQAKKQHQQKVNDQKKISAMNEVLIDAHFSVIFRDPVKVGKIEQVAKGEKPHCYVTMEGMTKPYLVDQEEAKKLIERYAVKKKDKAQESDSGSALKFFSLLLLIVGLAVTLCYLFSQIYINVR